MRRIRAEIRMIPDSILKLIKTLGTTLEQGRKLTNAEVVSIAVAKLMGTYVADGEGNYLYKPMYEVCPDCSGLIEIKDYLNPPPNDEANIDVWKAIKRQHVARCTWVTMAMNGKFSNQAVTKLVVKKPNVIEMKHNDIKPEIEFHPNDTTLPIEDHTEREVKDIHVNDVIDKPIDKPSLNDMDFIGEETEQFIDEFGAVQTRVLTQKRKTIIDDSKKSIGAKDTDNVSVVMEVGDTNTDGGRSQIITSDQKERMGDRKSFQGKVTEKNVDDKTMVIKIDVKGKQPDIKADSGARVEKDESQAVPIRVAKARNLKSNTPDNTEVGLDNMGFE